MNHSRCLAALAMLTISGCGQRVGETPVEPPVASVDQTHWSLKVETFHQSDTVSTLKVLVGTPVPARITFHEPSSVTSQSFIGPVGQSFTIHKQLKPSSDPDLPGIQLETTVNSDSPSITYFGTRPGLTIPQLQRRVLVAPVTVAFGESVVVARDTDGRETTVMVDLRSQIDQKLVHAPPNNGTSNSDTK